MSRSQAIKKGTRTADTEALRNRQFALKLFEPMKLFLDDCLTGEFSLSEDTLLVKIMHANKEKYVDFNSHSRKFYGIVDSLIASYKQKRMLINQNAVQQYIKSKTLLMHLTEELIHKETPEIVHQDIQSILSSLDWAKKLIETTPFFILSPILIKFIY